MANILLTAARAQRAAKQYLGDKSMYRMDHEFPDSIFHYHCQAQGRYVSIHQEERGSITFTERHGTRQEDPIVYCKKFHLPAIGPIDFNTEWTPPKTPERRSPPAE